MNAMLSGIPAELQEAIEQMELSWEHYDNGERFAGDDSWNWDRDCWNLKKCIDACEEKGSISGELACFLYQKYLRVSHIWMLENRTANKKNVYLYDTATDKLLVALEFGKDMNLLKGALKDA